ncbi:hypothetical protein R1flu_003944 [Riccia fluitans]|uniref:Uncharacterized protein n=1 Tax=Riccia fluitans TaxID=41844 RepID=A0ABD1YNY1_9MARC
MDRDGIGLYPSERNFRPGTRGGRGMDSFIGDAPEPKWPQHGPYSSSARADSAGSPDAEGLPWIRSRGAFSLINSLHGENCRT